MSNNSNQSPDFTGFNAWNSDPFLQLTAQELPESVKAGIASHGAWAGRAETNKLARMANINVPVLHTHNANGGRQDEVEFHPAWHALMRKGVEAGLHSSLWTRQAEEAEMHNLARSARVFISSGVEMGHLCPLMMTSASVPVLMKHKELSNEWLPKLLARKYDFSNRPVSAKSGITIGMAMTERTGGSDINQLQTTATEVENGVWRINGDKWFMSAPMCDAFMVLAKTTTGVSCFMVPRKLPDASENGFEFQRLKDKLGNRSNASSEVHFNNALGFMMGDEGRGVATIMQMVGLTRLDCAVSSAGLMRISLAEAVHHARHRNVFGEKIIDQPIMQRVLADMSLDVAAATALCMRLASAFDKSANSPDDAAYVRLMTPVIKYWVCKTAPALIQEAMECLGGNGYIESGNLARHYREAPLNAIWEGAGNVMCLDVMRVISKNQNVLHSVLDGIQKDLGGETSAKTVDVIRSAARMTADDPGAARLLVEQLAFTAAAAELSKLGISDVTSVFKETRLGGLWRNTYGMLDNRYDYKSLINKIYPE